MPPKCSLLGYLSKLDTSCSVFLLLAPLLPRSRMTGWRWCSLSQRSLISELHPFRDSSLAQHIGCIYSLFIVTGLVWLVLKAISKQNSTLPVNQSSPALVRSQVWLMQLCRFWSMQSPGSLNSHPPAQTYQFPFPCYCGMLYWWTTTAFYLTCGQFYFQEQKSWKALQVLPTGQLCKSLWRNPPSLEAAKQEPRTEMRLACRPTAQRPQGWAVKRKPRASARWIPRVKLKIIMELIRIHLRLHLCGKTKRKSYPCVSFIQYLGDELSSDPSNTTAKLLCPIP